MVYFTIEYSSDCSEPPHSIFCKFTREHICGFQENPLPVRGPSYASGSSADNGHECQARAWPWVEQGAGMGTKEEEVRGCTWVVPAPSRGGRTRGAPAGSPRCSSLRCTRGSPVTCGLGGTSHRRSYKQKPSNPTFFFLRLYIFPGDCHILNKGRKSAREGLEHARAPLFCFTLHLPTKCGEPRAEGHTSSFPGTLGGASLVLYVRPLPGCVSRYRTLSSTSESGIPKLSTNATLVPRSSSILSSWGQGRHTHTVQYYTIQYCPPHPSPGF